MPWSGDEKPRADDKKQGTGGKDERSAGFEHPTAESTVGKTELPTL